VPDTWLRSWTLLDLFLVLVIAFAVGRMFGAAWGALALVTLVLVFPEEEAPRWVWLAALAAEALARVLPRGRPARPARLVRLATWAALVLTALPFAIHHLRQGMYPALEQAGGYASVDQLAYDGTPANAPAATTPEPAPADKLGIAKEEPPELAGQAQVQQEITKSTAEASAQSPAQAGRKGHKQRLYNVQDYDKSIAAQTGPGVPRWSWRDVPIRFSGPVERGQRLSLMLVPPAVNLVLAIVRVALLMLLVLCLIGFFHRLWPRLFRSAAGAALLVVLLAPARARAGDLPPPELLNQLRERLLVPAACRPHCASSPRMELELTPALWTARLEVGLAAPAAVPLPGGADQLTPDQVTVDGKPATALRRGDDGLLWLALEEGPHQVLLSGRLPPRDVVQLGLPLKPRRVVAKPVGWVVEGLHEDGLADDNLQLTRVRGAEPGGSAALVPGAMPPFVRVERNVNLALGWSVDTRVTRLTPTGTAIVVEVPLLAGESVTTASVRVQNGRALVNMAPQVTEVAWSSVLAEKSPIVLAAPDKVAWTEIWRLDVSPVWHMSFTGIPVVFQQDAAGDRLPEWRPWPGEKVTVDVVRPEGIPGQTLTIDHASLDLTPGARASDAVLTLELRSSRGGPHVVTLPAGAQLTAFELAGRQQPTRQDGRKVTLPLAPGRQAVKLAWREPRGARFVWRAPEVDLGNAAANLEVQIHPPQDRWILFVSGPRLGPAVLFWSLLLVLMVVALALGRVRQTPLRAVHWALLAVGLSQVPVPAAALVAAWFVLMGLRRAHPDAGRPRWFNLRQVGLALWTVGAIIVLLESIQRGLLGEPEMQIHGNGSGSWLLRWFDDRSAGALPQPLVCSVPLLVYRGAMLAWALWLAVMMLRWPRWAWDAFSTGGLWRRRPPRAEPAPAGNGAASPDR
jgi:hypothetical protein